MNQEKLAYGTFTTASTAAEVWVECGFAPDYIKLINGTDVADKITQVEWTRSMGTGYLKHTNQADNGSTGHETSNFVATGAPVPSETNVVKPKAWAASTAYVVGDIVRPTTNNGYFYMCSTAGTSHSAEPTSWGTTVAGTTSEGGGTVVWTCYAQSSLPVQVAKKRGFTVPAALQVDSAVVHWLAMRV